MAPDATKQRFVRGSHSDFATSSVTRPATQECRNSRHLQRKVAGQFDLANFDYGRFASILDSLAVSAGASSTLRAAKRRWPRGHA
jgi:hypothetical protein